MKRILTGIIVTALACTLAAAGHGLPRGSFSGSGEWQAPDGSTGEYETETVITDATIDTTYVFEQGGLRRESHSVRIVAKEGGFFDLLDDSGTGVGSGYCIGEACFYRVTYEGGIMVEESLRLEGRSLHKFGSKKMGDFTVAWTEDLAPR